MSTELRQQVIPGTQPNKRPALERAMEEYEEAKQARMAATTTESEKKEAVIARMRKAELNHYRAYDSDLEAILEPGKEVFSCKKKKPIKEDNGESEK